MSLSSLNKEALTEKNQLLNKQQSTISDKQKKTLKRLAQYARFLDSQFQIPGTSVRFGWDAVIGLIPGFGDMLAFGFSVLLIVEAKLAGAPLRLLARMFVNVFVEMIIGMVPVLGDLFDIYWKANVRNIELLSSHLEEIGEQSTESKRRRWLTLYYLAFLSLFAYVLYLVWTHRDFIISLF